MEKNSSSSKYILIAALCEAISLACNVINKIIAIYDLPEYNSITFLNIIIWMISLGMVVALYMKNKKCIIGIAGIRGLLVAYNFVSNGIVGWSYDYISGTYVSYFKWNVLLALVAEIAVIVIVILSLKNNEVVKKVWFVPGIADLLGCISGWIMYDYFSYLSVYNIFDVLSSAVGVAAYCFIGIWLKEKTPVTDSEHFEVKGFGESLEIIGDADKLKKYKEMLDSEIITQEEFEKKKKEILGL